MKKIVLVLLVLSMLATALAAVSCGGDTTTDDTANTPVSGDTVIDETNPADGDETNPEETEDNEDDGYISVAPADSDDRWGDIARVEG